MVSVAQTRVRPSFAVSHDLRSLTRISTDDDDARFSTCIEPIDTLYGGGIVESSVNLIAGEPGSGKSTIALLIAAKVGVDCLYVSAEETAKRVAQRAKRLGISADKVSVTESADVRAIETFLSMHRFRFAVIDSLQMLYDGEMNTSVQAVRDCVVRLMDRARKLDCALLLVSQVSREGTVQGMLAIEHMADTVVYIEREEKAARLVAVKNRFAETRETTIALP
jgi:DNA repair protein RadA/Sms